MAPKLSADVLGDYTIQGAEIAGAVCICSWPSKDSIGKEHRVNSFVPLGVTVEMVHGLWETAARASFRRRDLDLVT